jgi:DNA-binding MarR family transcriptional regulator
MATEREALIEEIIAAHHTMLRAISASAPSVWMELDLSMAQLKVLMTLYTGGALSIGQIAEHLAIGQPTASHLVDRLVQAQLVVRTEDAVDRRRTLAQLAPSGEELAERISQVRFATLRRWLVQLGDADLAAFHRGARALADVSSPDLTKTNETS